MGLLRERDFWVYSIGLAFAVLGPALQLHFIQKWLFRKIAVDAGASIEDADKNHAPNLAALVGIVERILFFGSLLTGKGEFVGVWLVLKAAGGWKGWSEYRVVPPDAGKGAKVQGRHIFNSFLIGSGVSVLFAGTASQSVTWAECGKMLEAITASAATLLFSLAILGYVYWWTPKPKEGK